MINLPSPFIMIVATDTGKCRNHRLGMGAFFHFQLSTTKSTNKGVKIHNKLVPKKLPTSTDTFSRISFSIHMFVVRGALHDLHGKRQSFGPQGTL